MYKYVKNKRDDDYGRGKLERIIGVGLLDCFFFKQKPAYEILSSLVGSEMRIRDRRSRRFKFLLLPQKGGGGEGGDPSSSSSPRKEEAEERAEINNFFACEKERITRYSGILERLGKKH